MHILIPRHEGMCFRDDLPVGICSPRVEITRACLYSDFIFGGDDEVSVCCIGDRVGL